MALKKLTWIYLASYLCLGGAGFALAPDLTLKLFLSDGDYGNIMPRMAGMFMVALGGLIAVMTCNNDFRYYSYSVFARTMMVAAIVWLYTITNDTLFPVIITVILIGLIPSWYLYLRQRE